MRGAAPPVLPSALPIERALRPAPRPTFSRRESRQRYARNLLVPGPPAQGGGPPWIPPPSALAVLLADKKTRGILGRGGKLKPLVCPQARWESPSGGEQRLRCWGDDNAPQGEYPEGVAPLGDSLVTFSSGRKSPGCRAERLHHGWSAEEGRTSGAPLLAKGRNPRQRKKKN